MIVKKRILCLGLSFLLTLQTAGGAAYASDFAYPVKEHIPIVYPELTCTGLETAPMEEMTRQMKELNKGEGNEEAVRDLCEQMLKEYDRQATLLTILENEAAADTTDEALAEELENADALMEQIRDVMMEGLSCAAKGRYIAEVRKTLPGEEQVSHVRDYEPDTEEANSIEAKELSLELEYFEKAGQDVSVIVDGEEWTFDKYMEAYDLSEEEDQKILLELWKAENAVLGSVYLDLVRAYTEEARYNGYDNYVEYAYEYYDRDYTDEEILSLGDVIKKEIVPLYRSLTFYMENLNTDVLYEAGNGDFEQILTDIRPFIGRISPALNEAFDYLVDCKAYSCDTSANRRDKGYTTDLPYYGSAVIVDRMTGDYRDYYTAVHEFGHFNNMFHSTVKAPFDYPISDIEEVHSQGLELLFMPYWREIFEDGSGVWMELNALARILEAVLDGMAVEEFEQTVFRNPDLSLDQMNELMKKILTDYGRYDSELDRYTWVETAHLYETPFYYIMYATSALAALEIWKMAQSDRDAAIQAYLEASTYTGQYYFLAILEWCGIPDPLQEEEILSIAEAVHDYIGEEEAIEEAA